MVMAFCNYCSCLDCKTGIVHAVDDDGNPRPDLMTLQMLHAPTEWNDWICATCFDYECCVDWQSVLGEPGDPCQERDCGHRPKLVGPFVPLNPT